MPTATSITDLTVCATASASRRSARRKAPLHHRPEAVRYALTASGYSQSDLARELDCSRSLVSEILAGTRNASPALLRQIAKILNCPVVVLQAEVSQ